ncbi:hypothetical protein D9619_007111 [Psilocybe cf. subviscida]|uniref:Hydrophobin n=1 Tax=Psilocybe cf. subviscida TaxID=2480587 RepID=A0A8H5B279_9AGAR|nr:hypothetical protein D9619_007111 [Psilocybe cf. subviscida]
MQFKLATFTTLIAAATLAAATVMPVKRVGGSDGPTYQCNVGQLACCNSVESSESPAASLLLGLLGVVLDGVVTQVGITCTPPTVIGIAGQSCTTQAVCCENNSFNGVIAVGCNPANVNL